MDAQDLKNLLAVQRGSNWTSAAYGVMAAGERVLLVNARGCGYPPTIQCEGFLGHYKELGMTFPCFYSRANPALALADYDANEVRSSLIVSAIPAGVMVVAGVGILILVKCLNVIDREVKAREEE